VLPACRVGEWPARAVAYRKAMALVRLSVLVVRGTGLLAGDRSYTGRRTSSDPYTRVIVGGRTQQTKVITRTLEPEWQEELSYFVRRRDLERPLAIEVLDEDVYSRDDRLGDAELDISKHIEAATCDGASLPTVWEPYTLNLSSQGSVMIQVSVREVHHKSWWTVGWLSLLPLVHRFRAFFLYYRMPCGGVRSERGTLPPCAFLSSSPFPPACPEGPSIDRLWSR